VRPRIDTDQATDLDQQPRLLFGLAPRTILGGLAELQETDDNSDAVIIGDLGPAFGYDVLNHAFRQVIGGAELIALQKNRYWMRADGLSLDVGPFVAAIEFATGCEAYIVGKPARGFFDQVLAGLGVSAAEAAMVGDDIESDIGGALRGGPDTILV